MLALKVKGGVGEVHLEFHCRTLQNCDNFGFMEEKKIVGGPMSMV